MITNAKAQPRVLYDAIQHPAPEAIVVYCSDPRFQIAFQEFVEGELRLPKGKYLPLVVGGGAGVLGHPEQLPKEFKFMKERFELYRSLFPTIRRVVLINHEDCRYYHSLKTKLAGFWGPRLKILPDFARDDLSLVSRAFGHLLSHLAITIELYYARFGNAEHSKIIFDKLIASSESVGDVATVGA